jgi:predicted RNase H-like HicB family nuclease
MKLVYVAIFTPWEDGDGFTVEVPDLPGCVTEGDNLAEAIEMGMDAACGWILGELEDGNQYPQPRNYEDVPVPDGSFKNLLVLDMEAYADQYSSKTIRKNITIPAWLNTYGEKNNINFSRILTESLLQQASR